MNIFKFVSAFYLTLWLAEGFAASEATKEWDPMDNYREKLRINFIKVLSQLLPETKILHPLETLIASFAENAPKKDGYWTYVTTSMLRVVGSPVTKQLKSMLSLLDDSAPPGSEVQQAAAEVREYLETRDPDTLRIHIRISDLFAPLEPLDAKQ